MKRRHALLALAAAGGLCMALLWGPEGYIAERSGDKSPLSGGLVLSESRIEDTGVPLADLPAEEGGEQEAYVSEVLALVNAAREEAGLTALTLDETLCAAAQIRAEECVGTFSHTRPDGTAYKTVLEEVGAAADYTGENLAAGHTTPEMVMASWLKSEGHRANILHEQYTKIGIGLQKNTGNRYKGYTWVQLFTD